MVVSHRGLEGWVKPDLLEEGPFLWGDTLRPQKARLLLALGLLETDDPERLQELFLEYWTDGLAALTSAGASRALARPRQSSSERVRTSPSPSAVPT